tara:strand:+ start:3009 stop:4451 length:1443 start_codon:yes stop_codon:yes gene_type:complete
MKFNYIFGNPPFQDSKNRNKTQHKLWIEFTEKFFLEHLCENGEMLWITPSSWGSPSNKIFKIFKKYDVKYLNLDIDDHFPNIGSTFSYSHIQNSISKKTSVGVKKLGRKFVLNIDEKIKYFPVDFCDESMSIHQKVMFSKTDKFVANYDYVTCHNVIRHTKTLLAKKIDKVRNEISDVEDKKTKERKIKKLKEYEEKLKNCVITLSEEKTTSHMHPVFHTNRKTWYSSLKQDFADKKKVMWTRSGYTKPFYDNGKMGCTDMGYYVLVDSDAEGLRLEKFLTSSLMSYIFRTAKWSGFGNEIVFSSIPKIDLSRDMSDEDYYSLFSLSQEEIDYLKASPVVSKKKKTNSKDAEVKTDTRKKNLGEVYTPKELVIEMMDRLSQKQWQNKDNTFIDPACGSGNFLVEIVNRKIKAGLTALEAVQTTYGIDIMQDNIEECRARVFAVAIQFAAPEDHSVIMESIEKNIKCGNSLETSPEELFIN